MLADEAGISRGAASNKLLELERRGQMTSRLVRVGGTKAVKAYKFIRTNKTSHNHTRPLKG